LLGGQFKTSADVAEAMLKGSHTVVTDGAAFGAEGFVRLSYATSMENLEKAVDRLRTLFGAASASA